VPQMRVRWVAPSAFMRNKRVIAVLGMALGILLPVSLAAEHVGDEILIRFRSGTTDVERSEFEHREGLVFLQQISTIQVRRYRVPAGSNLTAIVERFRQLRLIEFAEPNYGRQLMAVADPLYSQQWSLSNTGQVVNGSSGPAGIDIRWSQAMTLFRGRALVTVAVIDSGVAIDHKDIINNAWVVDRELYGRLGIDDDGNGFVDDAVGWDFYAQDSIPLDENGHGTHVASIIAGVSGNGIGGTGICSNARIMALRVLDQFGRGGVPKFARVSDVALALEYALRNGARIVNLSLGGPSYSSTEYLMLQALSLGGVLVVAAAGNGGQDGVGDNNDTTPFYPASYNVNNVISVAAQNRTGALAYFSNFGARSVHIAAPGTDIHGADITRRSFFTENFEGSLPGWIVGSLPGSFATQPWTTQTSGGNTYLTDHANGLFYAPWTNTWVRSPPISLVGARGARLTFNAAHDLADDWLWVEASTDGVNWFAYDFIYGSSLYGQVIFERNVDLSDFDGGTVYVRFRLSSDFSVQGYGVMIDNVSVSGVTSFDSSTPRFKFADGTSSAAPIVSGVAALVMAHRPDLTVGQVRNILLSSSRQLPSLAGKVESGGMIDAESALRMADATVAVSAPVISTQPVAQVAMAGQAVTLSVTATGNPVPSFQWRKNGVIVPGETRATLVIASAQTADSGTYSVVVSNSVGTVTSSGATLTVSAASIPPSVLSQPTSQSVVAGREVTFRVQASGTGPLIFQWRKGGAAIAGATSDSLTLNNVQVRDAGVYSVVVTNSVASVSSVAVTLVVYPSARLANLSVRTTMTAAQTLIVGVSVSDGSREILVRAAGPALAAFGLSAAMSDPQLELYSGTTKVFENQDWPATLAPTFSSVGAFSFTNGSRDAAFLQAISGSRSIQARGSGPGVVLVEAYETGAVSAARLVNVSARNRVGTGDDILIAGFNIAGTGTKQLLIRAVGPKLATFGVTGFLVDPKLEIYGASGNKLIENDNWAPTLGSTFIAVGAFPFDAASRDAALLTTLAPGSYTVQVRGADGGTGEALIEIYEVP
jgi:subtilisin family serine protease